MTPETMILGALAALSFLAARAVGKKADRKFGVTGMVLERCGQGEPFTQAMISAGAWRAFANGLVALYGGLFTLAFLSFRAH